MQEENIPVPKFFLVHNRKEFLKAIKVLGFPKKPVCFKPAKYSKSGGGRGFRVIRKKNSISKIILDKPDSSEIDYKTSLGMFDKKKVEMLVMEYLPGKEFSVYTLSNKGEMIFCVPVHVLKIFSGNAEQVVIENNSQLTKLCRKIIRKLNFDFHADIEFKYSLKGVPKLIEINPRMGGASIITTAAGVNLPYLSLKLAVGEKIPSHKIRFNVKMIRYWKELFTHKGRNFHFP